MSMEESCVEITVSTSPPSPKKKEPDPSNDADASSSPGRSSPEANCPICLGKPENKSFTDSCLHQFCFTCLLEWSKVKAECPLCKQNFKSIIHNVRSIEDYEQYYLSTTSAEAGVYVSREIGLYTRLESNPPSNYRESPSYRFRTTAVSSYLDYFVRLEEAISHRVIPSGPSFSGGTLWQRRRQRGTSDFRRNIYQQGLWVQRTSDVTGRVRECSPQFYRDNPAQVHRLVPWLNRELNVLLYENSPHIQHVMSRILELITQVHIRSPTFAVAIAPYIDRHTDHFIHEFHSFAISPFDLVGYDRHANYVGRSEIIDHEDISRDSDSDVLVLEEEIRPLSATIQLVESDSDDCIVLESSVNQVPEVITLDSDNDSIVSITYQPLQPSDGQQSQPAIPSTSQPGPSTSRRPRLKRNWLTVNRVPMPSTSENIDGCEISISITHSSRSVSPSVSEASTSSWVPIRKKPTKVKKRKEVTTKKRSRKGKPSKSIAKPEVMSDSEDDSSPIPICRGRKPSVALVSSSSSEDSDTDRKHKKDKLAKKPLSPTPREQKPSMLTSTYADSDSDRLYMATHSSGSSDESEYKPRLRSVVVKSTVKQEPRVISPVFSSSHSRESRDYDFSSRIYSDLPSSSRSRSDSYRSGYSYRGRRSSSSSERISSKRCKHYKKRSKK